MAKENRTPAIRLPVVKSWTESPAVAIILEDLTVVLAAIDW